MNFLSKNKDKTQDIRDIIKAEKEPIGFYKPHKLFDFYKFLFTYYPVG